MRAKTVFFLLSLCCFFAASAQKQGLTVTAYYAGDTVQMNQYDPTKFTHIIFSFCHLDSNRLYIASSRDTLRIQRLVQLKSKNPSLKVLLSLGGWGGCATCSDVFSTADGRRAFAASVLELSNYFGTDGIDLDWEYPTIAGYPGHAFSPEDKPHFTALVTELRRTLGTGKEISFAAGGFQKFIEQAIDWKQVMPLVNRVNLMTYDLVNGFDTTTGHHTALYSTARQKESTDHAVKALLKKGVPANKIVIGAAFYARIWQNIRAENNGLYQHGLFKGAAPFKQIETEFNKENGFEVFWDPDASASYLYNEEKGLFVTYEDKRSITEKVRYAKKKKLNGIMFWELSHDLVTDGLLDAIDKAKKETK